MSCAVKNCKNTKRFRPEGIHFHRYLLYGGLNIPSDGVVKICNTAEIFIKRMLLITNKPQQYYDKIDVLFPSFKDHFFATAIVEENHGYALIKAIVAAYSQIRLFN
ncbi:hypothetical protein NQ317_005839 [Molorchus minor]|uniref:Uncharacterized protein n=1 Tax=Molorchus minor TaxID=1323400 RepID=A0ABQ9J3K2_9CUCU|nr:hypothetical protein NQ317_005839 [Molorchus minor]